MVIGTDTTANVEAKGPYCGHGLRHVADVESAGKKNWNRNGITNTAAQHPIMGAPGTAKLFDRESGISGVQEEGIHMGGGGYSISDGLQSKNVDDLHQSDAGQLGAQLRVNLGRQVIAKL